MKVRYSDFVGGDFLAEIFLFSFNAVMPILLLALVGYILKVKGFAGDSFFKTANTMVFKVFLPVLLFVNVYEIKSINSINTSAIIFSVFAVLFICLTGYITAKLTSKNRRNRIGVITQCSFRSNYAIIGLPLAEALGGSEAIAFASVLSAVTIPLFNILAVMILSHYAESEHTASVKATVKKTAQNPLIIGVLLGVATVIVRNLLLLNGAGEPVFLVQRDLPFLYSALKSLSKVASPLALVVLGARFDFAKVKSLFKEILTGTALRLVFAPAFALTLAVLISKYSSFFNITAVEYPALISLFATPVAVSSAVMTGEIGGDEQLAGQLVVWTSLLSMPSMFAVIFVMKSLALI